MRPSSATSKRKDAAILN